MHRLKSTYHIHISCVSGIGMHMTYIDISCAFTMEILQSCTKPSIFKLPFIAWPNIQWSPGDTLCDIVAIYWYCLCLVFSYRIHVDYTFRKGIISRQGHMKDTHVDKQILFNLCSALLAMYTTFLLGIQNTKGQIFCKVVSGLLHYFTLASFGWMFVESVRQFLRYYKRSHVLPERFVLTGSVVSWGELP